MSRDRDHPVSEGSGAEPGPPPAENRSAPVSDDEAPRNGLPDKRPSGNGPSGNAAPPDRDETFRAESGFCADGEQEQWIADGLTTIGGRLPVNTDGGLIANGEPIGASGLRQIRELVVQLRGQAGARQVQNNPQVGYAHLYGAPGASAVTILSR